MKYIIGIDIGTTATKGILYDENSKTVKQASRSYPLIQDKLDQAIEDPEVIFSAIQQVIFELSQNIDNIQAISWSSQMHSLIALDKNKNLLTKSITWADNRCQKVVEDAKTNILAGKIYEKTGMPPHSMAPIYKLIWMKKYKPEIFKYAQYFIGIKEYVIYRLTGQLLTDTTMAAGWGLLNLKSLQWDQELLDTVGISSSQLPKIEKPNKIVSKIKPYYAQKLGLSPDTKIILGASDGYLSTIGVDVLNKQNFAVNIGTSAAIRVISPVQIKDVQKRIFCYPIDSSHYLVGGPVNNGGIVLQWAKTILLGPQATFDDYLTLASSAATGSRGLLFYPYLGGERAPIWNSQARGSFIGLTRQHGKAELAKSILEGIILNIKLASQPLIDNLAIPRALRVTGGFTKSELVCQLISDIFNLPVVKVNQKQSGAFSAMFLARQALKQSNSLQEISEFIEDEKVYFPNDKNAKQYQKIFSLYSQIGKDLERNYRSIAKLEKDLSEDQK
ncbi:gluconokinase [uncultured Lactobacillus sp.]|uniref:gluconokinase n=1 Tax=uncultured Lactobacillus sp. TaxID=153152 RepID=UPI0026154FA8|nr:gluconokinase [uncultured Lactobacillus sp.]